jgi:L-ascorbate oxidase
VQAGTFFYHGHYGMQRAAGLYGLLIIDVKQGEEEKFKYDGEINMLLSDWYHQDIYSQTVGLSSKPFRWVGEPQVSYFIITSYIPARCSKFFYLNIKTL